MEILSKLLDAAFYEGKIKYHPACDKIGLTHLCFIDDLIIFSDALPYSLQGISQVLHDFYVLFGLQVSYLKCELFCCNAPDEEQIALVSLLGMKLGKLPVRHLGVPLISEKLKDTDSQPLTSKFISFARRLQLIDLVLNYMINYWLSVFLLSKKVIKEVERLCFYFLWKGVPDSAQGAKVMWASVCLPKSEGSWTERSLQLEFGQHCMTNLASIQFGLLGSWQSCSKIENFGLFSLLKIPLGIGENCRNLGLYLGLWLSTMWIMVRRHCSGWIIGFLWAS